MAFNFFKKEKEKIIKPTATVYRKQIIEGYAIPAIIHNMNYFFTDLHVYENGRVYCWNFQDFDHFIKDVNNGWVKTGIPDGEQIYVHALGSWKITAGKWDFDNDTFISYVRSLVKELNPEGVNMYRYVEKKFNGIAIGEDGDGTIYKEKDRELKIFSQKIDGDSVHLFYKTNSGVYLVNVAVFADESVHVSRLEIPLEISFAQLEEMVKKGTILTDIEPGTRVHIHGLGSFVAKSGAAYVAVEDKLVELRDMLGKLKGLPSAIELCKRAHKAYLEDPTIANREKLKLAYENVPVHKRLYVGDMDTKDIPVRMIIYGEQEIENWSHYQLAKKMGEPLPGIRIPKPKDDAVRC